MNSGPETPLEGYLAAESRQSLFDPPTALVHYPDAGATGNTSASYVVPILLEAFADILPELLVTVDPSRCSHPVVQFSDYDVIDFDMAHTGRGLCNAYPIRKALTRKHHLPLTVQHYVAKRPCSVLKDALPLTWTFELSHADELDELWLDELYDLSAALDDSADKTYILKPSMADKGQGIRLFRTKEELERILASFEEAQDRSDDDDDDDQSTSVSLSRMRWFVVQEYIEPVLLDVGCSPSVLTGRKFHLRVYVLAVGALQLYVYDEYLALFASEPYVPFSDKTDSLAAHLTNTCLQDQRDAQETVHAFSSLIDQPLASGQLAADRVASIKQGINAIVAELWQSALGQTAHFQLLPHCFEIYGLDFLLDDKLQPRLLEVNACPDFAQSGEQLQPLIRDLLRSTVEIAIAPSPLIRLTGATQDRPDSMKNDRHGQFIKQQPERKLASAAKPAEHGPSCSQASVGRDRTARRASHGLSTRQSSAPSVTLPAHVSLSQALQSVTTSVLVHAFRLAGLSAAQMAATASYGRMVEPYRSASHSPGQSPRQMASHQSSPRSPSQLRQSHSPSPESRLAQAQELDDSAGVHGATQQDVQLSKRSSKSLPTRRHAPSPASGQPLQQSASASQRSASASQAADWQSSLASYSMAAPSAYTLSPIPAYAGPQRSTTEQQPTEGIRNIGKRRYTVLKEVGDGSFGTVWLADWHSPLALPPGTMPPGPSSRPEYKGKQLVAIKRMKKAFNGGWDECMNLKELKSLHTISQHANIIPLYDAWLDPSTRELYFVFECMEGNLYQLTKSRKGRPLALGLVASIYHQILSGLNHVHTSGYFHRDMKPENLLITTTGLAAYPSFASFSRAGASPEKDVTVIVKIADFGLARELKSQPPYTEYVSTRWYRAPEVLLRSRVYSGPVDTWALGTILAEIVTLKPLFPGQTEIDQVFRICEILGNPGPDYGFNESGEPIGGGDWPDGVQLASKVGFNFPKMKPIPLPSLFDNEKVPPQLIDCIAGLLRFEPTRRRTTRQCLEHAFFREVAPLLLPKALPSRSSSSASRSAAQLEGTMPVPVMSPRDLPPSHSHPAMMSAPGMVTQKSAGRLVIPGVMRPSIRGRNDSIADSTYSYPDSMSSSNSGPQLPTGSSIRAYAESTTSYDGQSDLERSPLPSMSRLNIDPHHPYDAREGRRGSVAGSTFYDGSVFEGAGGSITSSISLPLYDAAKTQTAASSSLDSLALPARDGRASAESFSQARPKWSVPSVFGGASRASASSDAASQRSHTLKRSPSDAQPSSYMYTDSSVGDSKKAKKEAEKRAKEAEKARRDAAAKAARDRARAVVQKKQQLERTQDRNYDPLNLHKLDDTAPTGSTHRSSARTGLQPINEHNAALPTQPAYDPRRSFRRPEDSDMQSVSSGETGHSGGDNASVFTMESDPGLSRHPMRKMPSRSSLQAPSFMSAPSFVSNAASANSLDPQLMQGFQGLSAVDQPQQSGYRLPPIMSFDHPPSRFGPQDGSRFGPHDRPTPPEMRPPPFGFSSTPASYSNCIHSRSLVSKLPNIILCCSSTSIVDTLFTALVRMLLSRREEVVNLIRYVKSTRSLGCACNQAAQYLCPVD
ncbi:uncharacterized protein L969DRAFT_93494 [Mixia osmundae IAM 14324]|uniref:Protein kinase domain-containing protein n=1 Tax=Mixia osmundae (strain CBS 9802 / IAM 14324 / JCM 22182 / KY 12970) TaxID=764103 RepID=G7DU49_MIXOS|nr:uncharacterized protein L969DRAFT_93494 [Mixia osmundae IAM 14324]KEI40975.1 hypothetical protein L969DRAFT_93494 [Mixia osmundae IAM 14324]GAA94109.1 hypothetical protein E5Q_00756 [Mixia osmundae IAM 14324]